MIHVVVRIVRAAIVPNPFVSGSVYVRGFGVPGLVGECLMFGRRVALIVLLRSASRSGPMRGNVSAANTLNTSSTGAPSVLLRENWQRQKQRYRQKSNELSHSTSKTF
jgi:hypothetical protein